jgi:hypothetical protein
MWNILFKTYLLKGLHLFDLVWFMVFNTTFNNISAISWRSVLLVGETGVPREDHQPVTSHGQLLSHKVASSTPPHEHAFELKTLVVIGTDCTGSCLLNLTTIRS